MSKIVLITGATAGIGEACAHTFARQDYNLIITGRRADRLTKLAKHITAEYNVKVEALEFDVQNKEAVVTKLEGLPPEWKKVDVLVNNAGLSLGLEPIQNGAYADWETVIDTNIKGLLYVSKIVMNWMIANKGGHIINMGSIAGKEIYANGAIYCASKAAVDFLSQGMRVDLLPYGIKVTAIHPGAVETEFSEIRFKGDKTRAKKVYEGITPLIAQDVAETIWFAASRPLHVSINEIVMTPIRQANATTFFRSPTTA